MRLVLRILLTAVVLTLLYVGSYALFYRSGRLDFLIRNHVAAKWMDTFFQPASELNRGWTIGSWNRKRLQGHWIPDPSQNIAEMVSLTIDGYDHVVLRIGDQTFEGRVPYYESAPMDIADLRSPDWLEKALPKFQGILVSHQGGIRKEYFFTFCNFMAPTPGVQPQRTRPQRGPARLSLVLQTWTGEQETPLPANTIFIKTPTP